MSIPIAIAIWGKIKERREKGELKTHLLVGDVGMIITPAISLILLAEFVSNSQAAAAAPGAAGLGRAVDASFTREHGHAGILSPGHTPMRMPNGAVPIPESNDNPMQSILGGM